MVNIIINIPLYFTGITISLIYKNIYGTRALVVDNGFCSSVVEHWSSIYNPEDADSIPSRKALELHFSHFSVWRLLDDTFLMIVHWKGISMQRHILASSTNLCTISEFDHFFFSHLAGLVSMLSLWLLLWFKTASTLSEAAMFNFDTKDFHRLVFRVQTTRKSSQAERNLWSNFEQSEISCKLPEAIASW